MKQCKKCRTGLSIYSSQTYKTTCRECIDKKFKSYRKAEKGAIQYQHEYNKDKQIKTKWQEIKDIWNNKV
jgi:hypothetical protein